jgi:hypothetical protein
MYRFTFCQKTDVGVCRDSRIKRASAILLCRPEAPEGLVQMRYDESNTVLGFMKFHRKVCSECVYAKIGRLIDENYIGYLPAIRHKGRTYRQWMA